MSQYERKIIKRLTIVFVCSLILGLLGTGSDKFHLITDPTTQKVVYIVSMFFWLQVMASGLAMALCGLIIWMTNKTISKSS